MSTRYSLSRSARRVLLLVGVVGLLGATAGCTEWLLASHSAAFGAGWVAGSLSTPTETRCFVNGVEVDCATVDAIN